MDHQPSGVTFGLIGHQESWYKISRFINSLRLKENGNFLPVDKIKAVFKYIPPRKLFDIEVISPVAGKVNGFYIETFISPDELDAKHLHYNLQKTKDACECAAIAGADVVSLGGFTSIILETAKEAKLQIGKTSFTTGNTLTAAFIVKSIEKLCFERSQALSESNVLIVGSTGDIGSACAQYFSEAAKGLLLCARQPGPLKRQTEYYRNMGICTTSSIDINQLLPFAGIIICVASSLIEGGDFRLLADNSIICDAGYPKNISLNTSLIKDGILFSGGMGSINAKYNFNPDYRRELYDFPNGNFAHGCLLESMVLAMENKPIAYSWGRGNISKTAINEMVQMAARHGIEPAIMIQNL